MQLMDTLVGTDKGPEGDRTVVTFLGEGGESVEVRMAGAVSGDSPRQIIEKAKVLLLHVASSDDSGDTVEEDDRELTAAPMAAEERDPFVSAPDDNDDNYYQEPDQALPSDQAEQTLGRDPAREGGRFGET
ncbi:MAG TPA: hypothetical protein VFT89_13095 [Rhizobiaceae bacterium]|nr:hypothetical protein [Rhizobiaceae bacterium]